MQTTAAVLRRCRSVFSKRVVVLDVGDGCIELVNPEIIFRDGEQREAEGCLSIPGEYGTTIRPAVVKVKAQDRNGKWQVLKGEGLKARCFCHEIDHLDNPVHSETRRPDGA